MQKKREISYSEKKEKENNIKSVSKVYRKRTVQSKVAKCAKCV